MPGGRRWEALLTCEGLNAKGIDYPATVVRAAADSFVGGPVRLCQSMAYPHGRASAATEAGMLGLTAVVVATASQTPQESRAWNWIDRYLGWDGGREILHHRERAALA